MKKTALQAFFLALVFAMPLIITSVVQLGDDCETHVFFENCTEKNEESKKESDTREAIDDKKEFVAQNQNFLVDLTGDSSHFFSRNKPFLSLSRDVLTPPPKFI